MTLYTIKQVFIQYNTVCTGSVEMNVLDLL